MGSVFSEPRMLEQLNPLIGLLPGNQTLRAGIHAVLKRAVVTRLYRNAHVDGVNVIAPTEENSVLFVRKSKICDFDAYIGVTQDWLLIVPCDEPMWAYEIYRVTDEAQVREYAGLATPLESPMPASSIVPVVPLASVAEFTAKKNWIGAYNCRLVMSDGDEFKMLLPRLGGLGGGMPHHKEYRDAIVSALSERARARADEGN